MKKILLCWSQSTAKCTTLDEALYVYGLREASASVLRQMCVKVVGCSDVVYNLLFAVFPGSERIR
jgi:hypothetical protein